MSNATVLVTGGAGFVGSHLVDRLIKEEYRVVVVDIKNMEDLNPQVAFYRLDIVDKELSSVFAKERPALVFHYAAQADIRKSMENPGEDARVNILGTWNVLERCLQFGVKKVIFASSAAVYGETTTIPTSEEEHPRPASPYGVAKLTGELYLKYYYEAFGLSFVALRLANVYGPRQAKGVIPSLLKGIVRGEQPRIDGDGEQTRDFVFVADVVEASIRAAQKDVVGFYNIGTSKETSINEVVDRMQKVYGKEIKVSYDTERSGGQRRSSLAIGRAERELGWKPSITLEEGLRKIVV